MKKCSGCSKLVKNNFTFCFECKEKQEKIAFIDDDTNSQPESTPESKYHKEIIPKTVKNALWINYYKDQREGKCMCCRRETISIFNFHCGHIKAEASGGKTTLDNLIPLCMLCNCSIQKMDVYKFIAKYDMHYTVYDGRL